MMMSQEFKLELVKSDLEIQHSDASTFKLLLGQALEYKASNLNKKSTQPCVIVISASYLYNTILVKSVNPFWLISGQQAFIEELLLSFPKSGEFLNSSTVYNLSNETWLNLHMALQQLNNKIVSATSLQTRSQLLRFIFALCIEHSLEAGELVLPSHTSYTRRKLALNFKGLANLEARNKISVKKFAEMLCLSYPKLYSICQEYFLDTPKNVVIKEKIIAIKRDLIMGNKALYQIAEDFGFEDASNFSKFFIKHAAEHPSKFRRQSDWLSE